MWKYMNEDELKNIRHRKKNSYKKIWRPLLIAFFLLLLRAIVAKLGFDKYNIPEFLPITWGEFIRKELFGTILFGAIVFFILYLWQIIKKRPIFPGPEIAMCLKCEKVKKNNKILLCDCGGKFVPLDELEWVAVEKVTTKNND